MVSFGSALLAYPRSIIGARPLRSYGLALALARSPLMLLSAACPSFDG